jgi:VIT1/CCC1 family predicted Fe2+/Mn2+ transporter
MSRLRPPPERLLVNRIGWLRAAVLGANDGILSTASLIVGVGGRDTARSVDRGGRRTGGWRRIHGRRRSTRRASQGGKAC